jgi:NADH:ubiquinone reductase (H+-translocating)
MAKRERIVILGAGFGGLVTARTLAKARPDIDIILIDKSDEHLYTPWLYEVATSFLVHSHTTDLEALRNTAGISVSYLISCSGCSNIDFRIAEVTGIDARSKHVLLKSEATLSFDKLVIALGSEISYYGIEGLGEFSLDMKTMDNCLEVRARLEVLFDDLIAGKRERVHIMIGGGGATGVETVAELQNFLRVHAKDHDLDLNRIHVSLVNASPSILSRFTLFMQKIATRRLKDLRVELFSHTVIQSVKKSSVRLAPSPKAPSDIANHIKTRDQNFDILLWAGGVQPLSLLKSFDLPKEERGRLKVDATLAVEGFDDIYALGDIIFCTDTSDNRQVPGAAWSAIGEAAIVAKNLASSGEAKYHLPKRFPGMIAIGGSYAVGSIYGFPVLGYLAFWMRRFIDLHYFMKLMTPRHALVFWWRATRIFAKNG